MKTVESLDQEIMEACRLYVDNLTKPLGSLGRLEDMAVRLAGIRGEKKPAFLKKRWSSSAGTPRRTAAATRRRG